MSVTKQKLAKVRAAAVRLRHAEDSLHTAVLDARRAGATWQDVGSVLGITRQAAFKRFGHPVDPDTGLALPAGPQLFPARLLDQVVQRLSDEQYGSVRDMMTKRCSRELSVPRLRAAWVDVLTEIGQLERWSERQLRVAGVSKPPQPTQGPFVVRALLEHEAGECVIHISVNRAGSVDGLLLAPPAAEATLAF